MRDLCFFIEKSVKIRRDLYVLQSDHVRDLDAA